jgi:hypothetical protein
MRKSLAFYFPISIDSLAVLISLYFLITDAIHESSSDNGMLTMITLVMIGYIILCWYLFSKHNGAGTVLAWIPAVPLMLYGLFVLMFVILKPDMR